MVAALKKNRLEFSSDEREAAAARGFEEVASRTSPGRAPPGTSSVEIDPAAIRQPELIDSSISRKRLQPLLDWGRAIEPLLRRPGGRRQDNITAIIQDWLSQFM